MKKVRFAIFNDIFPMYYGVEHDTWLNAFDYMKAKRSTYDEIKLFIAQNPGATIKDATRMLYQPRYIIFNESYFEKE